MMKYASADLPGTPQHRAVLQSILAHYENDARILAVIVFGSLGRGKWDRFSDLDLDVVLADGIRIDIRAELESLGAALATVSERTALLIPSEDEADVVFNSLLEMSIRYHSLSNTSPAIVESMLVLAGRIDPSVIAAAGLANREAETESPARDLDRCIRYALEAGNALQRGRPWSAVELLHLMRKCLMELYTRCHNGQRAYQFFEKTATRDLQNRLGGTLPQYVPYSMQESLAQFLDILENHLDELTGGQAKLTRPQAELLKRIRSRTSSV